MLKVPQRWAVWCWMGLATLGVDWHGCWQKALAGEPAGEATPLGGAEPELRVGAVAVDLKAEDDMPIAGSIHAWYAKGQEGKLRALAVVLQKGEGPPVAIVACDVLIMAQDLLAPVFEEIERRCKIPASHVMIHATHTHHAPSTCRVHGYGPDERFCREVQKAISEAVAGAQARLAPSRFFYAKGHEDAIGQNSRLLLQDGTIYWIGPRKDVVRPTGPVDPDVPVLVFRSPEEKLQAMLFAHSAHSIGALKGGVRSPTFFGLAAQSLEEQYGGMVAFLQGASGSTHRMDMPPAEAYKRIRQVVEECMKLAKPMLVDKLVSVKRPFTFRYRHFDEAAEEKAVTEYCRKRVGGETAEAFAAVFRQMRKELAPLQGKEKTSCLQVIRIGPVAVVGLPGEVFTALGLEIKRRSPFKETVIVELANDWIGYIPDQEGYRLGGYQVWTGLHSYVAPGTGERMVEQALEMLRSVAD
ncbi:MAG: hypothetical protein NZ602_10340 [Thermoguttaceae bacterium]|nr:hypothetical protein [Thermoguttaceae bacterium]MDW8039237.1 hypothetical protein [Thermoguttaceae bacterium]